MKTIKLEKWMVDWINFSYVQQQSNFLSSKLEHSVIGTAFDDELELTLIAVRAKDCNGEPIGYEVALMDDLGEAIQELMLTEDKDKAVKEYHYLISKYKLEERV